VATPLGFGDPAQGAFGDFAAGFHGRCAPSVALSGTGGVDERRGFQCSNKYRLIQRFAAGVFDLNRWWFGVMRLASVKASNIWHRAAQIRERWHPLTLPTYSLKSGTALRDDWHPANIAV
jgi:hypothetical protein